ncbi:MAG: hypothetical protein H0X38_13865 [Planctomycetes bacterium]|nr:hypothetical protein [Planctomycetota bacterium]
MSTTSRIITTTALFALLAQAGWAEEEEKVTVDQLPAAVKTTLEAAAKGAALSEFEREHKKGKIVYTAEIPGTEKGTVIEFTVAEDGTLLKTETEKADVKEDGEKDGEKGNHEGKHDHTEKGEH